MQTGNKYRVQRMAILIKKFLNMNIDDFKIEDETNSLIQMKVENWIMKFIISMINLFAPVDKVIGGMAAAISKPED